MTHQFLRKRIMAPIPPSMMEAGPAAREGMRVSLEEEVAPGAEMFDTDCVASSTWWLEVVLEKMVVGEMMVERMVVG